MPRCLEVGEAPYSKTPSYLRLRNVALDQALTIHDRHGARFKLAVKPSDPRGVNPLLLQSAQKDVLGMTEIACFHNRL
jgi:hypothetical protein